MMGNVANQPKTTLRNVRIDDELWADAKKVAAGMGTNVSEVIRVQLRAYVDENKDLL